MVDSSGSINFADGNNWNLIKAFIINLSTEFFNAGYSVQIGVVVYSTDVVEALLLSQGNNLATVTSVVNGIAYLGDKTNTAGGLETAINFFSRDGRQDASRFIILLTDGTADIRADEVTDQATEAKGQGISIITIGVSRVINVERLREISGPIEGSLIRIDIYAQLQDQLATVTDLVIANLGPAPTTTVATSVTGSILHQQDFYLFMLNSDKLSSTTFMLLSCCTARFNE